MTSEFPGSDQLIDMSYCPDLQVWTRLAQTLRACTLTGACRLTTLTLWTSCTPSREAPWVSASGYNSPSVMLTFTPTEAASSLAATSGALWRRSLTLGYLVRMHNDCD